MTALSRFAAGVPEPVLVLHGPASGVAADGLREQGHHVHPLDRPLPDARPWGGVALVVTDRLELRVAVAALPHVGDASAFACLLTSEQRPVHLVAGPEWPRVLDVHARRLPPDGAITVVHLDRPVAAGLVLRDLARLAAPARPVPARIAIADPGTPAIARGPLDEGVLNPIGFDPEPQHGLATLTADGPTGLRLHGVARVDVLDPVLGATAHVVSALRAHLGVRVSWSGATPELARTVAGLAMAGVPLVGDDPPPMAMTWLGDALHEALTGPADLADPLRREEHSIRQRRAALLTHASPAWRQRVARATGRAARRFPTCSVVLATRRPHQLDFAARQVARQRGVDPQVVVVAHGFEPDRGRLRDQLGGLPAEVLSLPADTLFGDVLDAGVRASSGDVVVKMDDDDWYGRDFLLDLMLAREYSGAHVVGTTAELVYLEQLDRTVRGRAVSDSSERFARFVAGGSLSLTRDLLHALGGFRPVRRFVDHQLLQAALSTGATVYRGHGLGYLLRRTAGGHTWDPGVEFFLDSDRVAQQWRGFVPSRLLEVDPVDAPVPASTGAGGP